MKLIVLSFTKENYNDKELEFLFNELVNTQFSFKNKVKTIQITDFHYELIKDKENKSAFIRQLITKYIPFFPLKTIFTSFSEFIRNIMNLYYIENQKPKFKKQKENIEILGLNIISQEQYHNK